VVIIWLVFTIHNYGSLIRYLFIIWDILFKLANNPFGCSCDNHLSGHNLEPYHALREINKTRGDPLYLYVILVEVSDYFTCHIVIFGVLYLNAEFNRSCFRELRSLALNSFWVDKGSCHPYWCKLTHNSLIESYCI